MPRRVTRKNVAAATTPAAGSGVLPGNGAEDESADPVGDGHSDGDLAASLPPTTSSERRSSKGPGSSAPRGVRRQALP